MTAMQALSDFPPAKETPTKRTALAGIDEIFDDGDLTDAFGFIFCFAVDFTDCFSLDLRVLP